MLRQAYALLVFWMVCGSFAWAETMDKIVANVNGDIILYSELKDRVREMEKDDPKMKTDDPAKQAQIQREVLRLIVREKLTGQEVRRLKITVADRDVESAVEGIKRENQMTDSQFEYVLQQQGQTLAQLKDDLRKQLERNRLVDRVLKSRTIITEAQVDEFLRSGEVLGGDRRRLAVLFLPVTDNGVDKAAAVEKRAGDLHSKLKTGGDFSRAVREYSKGPAVEEGGDIGFMSSSELAKPIEAATRNLGPNEISEVIKAPGGFYIFKVLEVQRERISSNDPNIREKARRQLLQKELDRKFSEWIQELEGRAFIQISL
jgi:peptidyl-prolyl cis-trans isomerase SurA